MDICILSNDKLYARFIELEIDYLGLSSKVVSDTSTQASLYICDLDCYDGELPAGAVGFGYDDKEKGRVETFWQRPISVIKLHQYVLSKFKYTLQNPVKNILTLNQKTRCISGSNGEVRLSKKELALFCKLHEQGDLDRNDVGEIFGQGESNVVDVYMHYLRKKLKSICKFEVITSCRGRGYSIKSDLEVNII